MNRFTWCASAIALALSSTAMAAPTIPQIDMDGSNYLNFSKIQLNLETVSGYNSMVQYFPEADINIKFNQWSGTTGNTYNVYFDNVKVASGPISGSTTIANFKYAQGGKYNMKIEVCDGAVCSVTPEYSLVVADTDGSHLDPLTMNVDPNNKNYTTPPNTVVGTYFVEWGIYERAFTVDNIPADNLTHILYGFIPICGPNDSLKRDNPLGHRALVTACSDVPDYEVVVHDPWAAFQKSFPQAGHDSRSPIRGNYAMLMALKKNNPNLKIVPSIGGWTLSDPFYDFTNKANRDTFVASVKRFLETWKFYDGVDIDWEFPGGDGAAPGKGDPVNDGPAYIALMQELRTMLNGLEASTGRKYELTSAIGMGYDKIRDVDYAQAVQHMDYIFAMTYDFYGGWSNVLGHHAALNCGTFMAPGQCEGVGNAPDGTPYGGPAYTTSNGIDLLLQQGVPANKIVAGAAMYGRGWEGVSESSLTVAGDPMTGVGNGPLKGTSAQGVWQDGVIDYKNVKSDMVGASGNGINGFEVGYDTQAEAAWAWNRSNGKLVTFDNPRSVKAKGNYVRSLGLAGLFSWEIDADNGDILNAMHEGLANSNGNIPPVANPGVDQTVDGGAAVTLNGSQSSDSDGQVVGFLWKQIKGTSVALNGANQAQVSFTAPSPATNENLVFSLTVTDDKGATATKNVTITVRGSAGNLPPEVVVTAPAQVNAGDSFIIDVSASTDPNGDTLTFSWQLPAGVDVTDNGSSISVVAPSVTQDTNYDFTVTASDGALQTSQTVTVLVKVASSCPAPWNASNVYVKGDKVLHNSKVYVAGWWNQNEEPGVNPWGAWKLDTPSTCQ